MKRMILLLWGLVPFGVGFLINVLLMKNLILPFKIIGIAFLLGWGLLGFLTNSNGKTIVKTAVFANLPAFVVLLLILYQEIKLGHYWMNLFGIATQFFFLPLLNISFSLTFWEQHVWPAYIVSFILMCVAFLLGGYVKKHCAK